MALGKGLNSLIPQNNQPKKTDVLKHDVNQDKNSRIWQIPISEITPNPEQPRKVFSHDDLEDLILSIKQHGVLQPVVVSEKNDGGYELIAGERRLRASQMAGKTTVPAMVRAASQKEKLELALIENIQRQNLNPIEEAFAYKRLSEQYGLTQEQIAEQVGKSRPVITNTIRLLDLPEEIQKALIDGKINTGKARALLSLKDTKQQLQVFGEMTGNTITVRDVEKAVFLKGENSRKGSVRRDPNLLSQEKLLEDRLGSKVRITQKGERGTIVIEYYSKEELRRLIAELS